MTSESYDAILSAHQQRKLEALSFRPENTSRESLDALRLAREQGRLSVVLGAGCSVPFKLPAWNALVSETVCALLGINHDSEIARYLASDAHSPLVLIRFLKAHDLFDQHFFSQLKQRLYRDYDAAAVVPYFDSLILLISGKDGRPAPQSVITYNFDDILQQRISTVKRAISCKSIYNEETYRLSVAGFPIYYPHGYLPLRDNPSYQDGLVLLSEEHYHQAYNSPHNWANLIQLTHFCQNTCLFIGMSFRDPDVRRLLDLSRGPQPATKRHFAIMKSEQPTDNEVNAFANYMTQTSLRLLGVETIWINDYPEIDSVLRAI